ncbi:GNAT family N-acetyltransferase [Ornithinibacillus scapharcae]|uniref:GNAT family N-acetyltransferase n=1 Tax=Ornithinibacillus scapharcae TaxID=1147159 RepID=UPI000225BFE3|nr:GNAT family N-acetyltransferase [Ornithinibacillus scapharcae]
MRLAQFQPISNIGILWVYIQDKNQEKQAYIYDIELDEDQRGKGLGKATMLALEEYAKSENIKQIRLHVFAHNQRAIALYKKMGYEMTNHQMLKRLP